MNPTEKNQLVSRPRTDFLSFDIQRVFSKALSYWYLIVLSLLVCLLIAHLVNRYSTKIYSIEASIIIKEADEVSGGELIYSNPLIKFYRNYLNELYIIKSTPLIAKTVSDLGFDKVIYREGDLKRAEAYKNLPFKVDVLSNPPDARLKFTFVVKNENSLALTFTTNGEEQRINANFNQVITHDSISFLFKKTGTVSKHVESGEQFHFALLRVEDIAASYITKLKADWAEEGAGVINLSIKGSVTDKELDFVSTLISNYQRSDLENKNVAASNAIKFITDQLVNISDSLRMAQSQLEAFKNKNIVTDLNSEAMRLYQKMEGLEIQKTELLIRARYYNYLTEYINKSPELDQVILPSSIGMDDPILSGLISEMMKIQTELKLLARHQKLQNPIAEEKSRRIGELKGDILESVKNQKSVDNIKIEFLNKGIKEIDAQLKYLPVAERQLVDIKRNYALLDNLYNFLLQKKAEAGITKATNVSDVVLVNPPAVVSMVSPKMMRNYLLGFAFGLALPFFFIFLLEIFNSKIQSREDIEKATQIPVIGGVGHKRTDKNLEVFEKPKSAISESFRALRSNLFYFLAGRNNGVFLVSSSISGEGKTFTTINLASVFAMSGKRTLIVGADMRRPRIFSDFNLDNTIGLSSFLAGLATFEEVVKTTSFDNFFIVSGGPVPPNPSELILSERMKAFLDLAKQKFDFVIIDSPPLALVTDAFVLSGLVDHTLFIVRQNYTPKPLLVSIDDFYQSGKITRISIVLNDISKSGAGYGYDYGYGYGYGYGRKNSGGYYED